MTYPAPEGPAPNQDTGPPTPQKVNDFHQYDDTDRDQTAHHHTLGKLSTQAAPGNHRHDGTTGVIGAYSTMQDDGTPLAAQSTLNFKDGPATNDGTVALTNDIINGATIVIFHAHNNDDVDIATTSHHHTLGVGSKQAAAGNHTHTGFAGTGHTHPESDVTSLVADLASLVPPFNLYSGTGTPETHVTAPKGSIYTDSTGGAGTTLYVKETGSGNTGWVAK